MTPPPPPPTTPAAISRAYVTITAIFTLSASLIWGVNTLFLLDAGLDIFEVFVANAVSTAGMVLFEIPTGVVADTTGRRRSFLLAVAVLLVGTVAYVAMAATGAGVVGFSAASFVLGVGFSFYSGAVEAWMVDALVATGFTGSLDPVFARGSQVSGAAMLGGSVAGGLLGAVDLSWPFAVRAVLLAVVLGIGGRVMHDVGFVPRAMTLRGLPAEMRAVLGASVEVGWRARPVRMLVLVSLVHGTLTMWAFYAAQPYLLELLNRDAVWVSGVVTALVAATTIAGNTLVRLFTQFCGRRTTLLLASSSVVAVAAIGVGVAGSFVPALVLFLLTMGAVGVGTPVQQAYLHQVVPSSERATVVSFGSLLGSAGGIGGQLGLGYVARSYSMGAGYVVGGLVSFLALVPLVALRRQGQPADVIVGRRAGRRGPCAGQGLPQVALVDTTPREAEVVGPGGAGGES